MATQVWRTCEKPEQKHRPPIRPAPRVRHGLFIFSSSPPPSFLSLPLYLSALLLHLFLSCLSPCSISPLPFLPLPCLFPLSLYPSSPSSSVFPHSIPPNSTPLSVVFSGTTSLGFLFKDPFSVRRLRHVYLKPISHILS